MRRAAGSAAQDTIHIVRAKFIWQGVRYERLAVRNFGDRARMTSA